MAVLPVATKYPIKWGHLPLDCSVSLQLLGLLMPKYPLLEQPSYVALAVMIHSLLFSTLDYWCNNAIP